MAEWPTTWPASLSVVSDDEITDTHVELFCHRPDTTEALVEWTGGSVLLLNGGPVVVLPGTRPMAERLVGLGDFAARAGKGFKAEPGSGIGQRYAPTDDTAPEGT